MTAPEPLVPTAEDLPPDVRRDIEAGWRRAQRAHAHLGLDREAFTADVLALTARSRARLGLTLDAAALREDVVGLCFEDLYLARLCERGDDRAWTAFVRRYEPDLRAVLQRDWDASEAEAVAAEVLSEVSLAPPRGRSRTRLGAYDGTGPLWAWLATIGVRTARRRWRKRREVQLEATLDRVAPLDSAAPDMDDQVREFVGALRTGWAQLEQKERLALSWKHRAGLDQRVIARLLGVSEPTVSRLVTRGVAKLRGCVMEPSEAGSTPDAALWTRLESALSGFLERTRVLHPPEVE